MEIVVALATASATAAAAMKGLFGVDWFAELTSPTWDFNPILAASVLDSLQEERCLFELRPLAICSRT